MPPQMETEEVQDVFKDNVDDNEATPQSSSLPVRIARLTARNPYKCLFGSFLFAIALSATGLIGGNFTLENDNRGWRSRGTKIANREMQNEVISTVKSALFKDVNGTVWEDVENNVVQGFTALDDREEGEGLRRLIIDGCDASKYYNNVLFKDNLYAVYKTEPDLESSSKSILDPDVLFEICETETATQQALEEKGLCGGCADSSKCLPPHSLLLVLRLSLDGLDLSCSELKEKYTPAVQESFTNALVECTQGIYDSYDSITQTYDTPDVCPPLFQVNLVDQNFAIDGNKISRHSSSYFITYETDEDELFNARQVFSYTDTNIVGAVYDTFKETLSESFVDSVLLSDMALAVGSLCITCIAMCIHTKSIFLTVIGIFQIILSVPLSYFVYYFFVGMRFFPFLNFIGVFVAAALGADYIFVAVDKWKNARLDNPFGTTEDVAAVALPDAAAAMFLTTATTAVAFFATTICPVTPIFCFALFCGLMIMFNYLMNILLLFPALCLYDILLMRGSRNFFINCGCCSKQQDKTGEEKESLIHRILSTYYQLLHNFRYILLVVVLVATGICIYYALTIKLPDSVEVRLLPDDHEYEVHFKWKQTLLSFLLFYSGGSSGQFTFGVIPADTGDKKNPDSLSTLELDETFDPSTPEAQSYLLTFCDRLFATEYANPPSTDFVCPINEFDAWLASESASAAPSDEYISNCNNAESLPMDQEDFHSCMIAWSQLVEESNVLSKLGKVKIIRFRTSLSVGWQSPFSVMDKFWNSYEDWLISERLKAPESANKMFHTSGAFWFYDTNTSMLQTAIGACIIAVIFSAIVVLLASRSLILTLFSAFCITYVLAATTSSLVAFGWSLGFLESVCFAILVGISCDFVIHFGHAYNHLGGKASKHERTKFSVIHMGPSILAAAFTTMVAATAMLFCTVIFFTKFALILLMTILHATIGSFLVYLVFSDIFGPSEPTKFYDSLVMKLKGKIVGRKEGRPESPPVYDDVSKSLSFEKEYDLGKSV